MTFKSHKGHDLKTHFEQADKQQIRGLGGCYGEMAYAGYVLDVCDFPHKARVLDLGCGSGETIQEMSRQRPDIVFFGQDISENLLARAKEKVPYASIAVGDAREGIGFEGTAFDAVYSFSFAQYLSCDELLEVNRSLSARLVGGGRIYHLSIPDKTKKSGYAMVNQLNRKGPALWRYSYGILVALAKAGNNRYGKFGRWHDPFGLQKSHADIFDVTIKRPGDVWYRFDLLFRPR